MPKNLVLLFLTLQTALDAGVVVQFNPLSPQVGPYPADALTAPDSAQLTGERVNLPLPDCTSLPALCSLLALTNQLDGFNVQARIGVSFSGAIDTSTLTAGIYLVALDNLSNDEVGLQKPGDIVAINQVTYDPVTNTAYAKPDAALDQHRRYLLLITDAVHDASGNPVTADPAFKSCTQTYSADRGRRSYCSDLGRTLANFSPQTTVNKIVSASVFTTMSATAWMQSAHRQLQNLPIVVSHPDGPYLFNVSDIANLTVNFDTGSNTFSSFSVPIGAPGFSTLFGSLGRLAFGSYLSPMVLNAQQTIDPAPTRTDAYIPMPTNEVAFHVYLPNTPAPPSGYPVVIFGHGFDDSSVGGPTAVAPELAQAGFATIAINAFGSGYGPQSNLVITDSSGNNTTVSIGGRGIDRNGDGIIEGSEGCQIITPLPLGLRDCIRQTAVDLMQLVRVIQAGLDVDGNGTIDLDGSRIYYAGQSFGAIYGAVLNAVEPSVRAAVLNVGGGSVVNIVRWSPDFADTAATFLTSQTPPLLPPGTPFVDNFPFRDQPVSTDPPGASDTEYYLELVEWLDNQGDPITFAPHLSRSTLPGIPAKSVLFQFARADQTVPNPTASDLIRAAGAESTTWLYRHDLAEAAFPGQLPANPHTYLALFLGDTTGAISFPSIPELEIGLATQVQMAGFFTSDGTTIPDMNQIFPGPASLFEIPQTLPNDPGYSQ